MEKIKDTDFVMLVSHFLFGLPPPAPEIGGSSSPARPVINDLYQSGEYKFMTQNSDQLTENLLKNPHEEVSITDISNENSRNPPRINPIIYIPARDRAKSMQTGEIKRIEAEKIKINYMDESMRKDSVVEEPTAESDDEDQQILLTGIPIYKRKKHQHQNMIRLIFSRLDSDKEKIAAITLQLFDVLLSHNLKEVITVLVTNFIKICNFEQV